MHKRITVAYYKSPEASRALSPAIRVVGMLGAELRAVTILESPPAYTAFAGAADPSLTLIINSDRMQAYERFAVRGPPSRLREAAEFEIHIVEGEEIDAIVRFLADYKADLLGIGLHHHPVAHITSLEHGLLTCTGCSLQRSRCPLNSDREIAVTTSRVDAMGE